MRKIIDKLLELFIHKEKFSSADHYNHAVNECRALYSQFNKGSHATLRSDHLNSLKLITTENFIKDVVGPVRNYNIRNLGSKIRLNFSDNVAYQLYQFILDQNNVIDLYSQAIKNNKILIPLGVWGTFSCNQSLLIENKMFLRFKSKGRTFWLIQRFSFFGIYFPAEHAYFSLIAHGNIGHEKIIEDFHTMLFQIFDKVILWDNTPTAPTFAGVALVTRRPFHYFIDMLSIADVLMKVPDISKNLKNFVVLSGGAFFSPQRFFGSHINSVCIDSKDPAAFNDYLISTHIFTMQPVRDIAKRFNNFNIGKDFYQQLIKQSIASANLDSEFKKCLDEAKNSTPLLWMGVCNEHRSWVENSDAICTIVNYFKNFYPETALIIDGLTAPEDMTREQLVQGSAQSDESAYLKIAKQLPGVKIINAIGLKSYEKIALAQQVDFFISCFLTDSLYVAHISSKPGLAYGPTGVDLIRHRHPMSVVIPKTHVTDLPSINPNVHSQIGLRYSIDPNYIAATAFKVFEHYKKLRHEDSINSLFSGEGYTLDHNLENNSIIISSQLNTPFDICAGEQVYTQDHSCTSAAYLIYASTYLFRFEAFSNKGSVLYIHAYAKGRSVFRGSFEAGRAKYITFPEGATHFRLFIRLSPQDELEFFDIHWNTDDMVGSVRLGGYLDIQKPI